MLHYCCRASIQVQSVLQQRPSMHLNTFVCMTYSMSLMCYIQSGLECIKERLWQETVQRYGVNKEFVKAEADTMREVLAELRKRYIQLTK